MIFLPYAPSSGRKSSIIINSTFGVSSSARDGTPNRLTLNVNIAIKYLLIILSSLNLVIALVQFYLRVIGSFTSLPSRPFLDQNFWMTSRPSE